MGDTTVDSAGSNEPAENANLFHVGDWPDEGALLGTMPEESTAGPIIVSNEFADVVVTQVRSRNGVRLDIWSPRRGTRIQFDAVALDCLSFQSPEFITELLTEKPSG